VKPTVTVLLLLCVLGSAASAGTGYQIVRLSLGGPEQLDRLADMNLDYVSEGYRNPCDIVVSDAQLREIRARGFSPEIVVPGDVRLAIPPEYHSPAETFHVFDSLQTLYPDILHLDTIGYTQWWGRPIWGIRVSDNPAQEEDEPAVLLVGVTHAREPLGTEIIIHLAKYLCSNYASSPLVRRWVDSLEIWLVPVLNLDGNQFMFDSVTSFPYWRKNQRDNDNNGHFNRDYDGVDLNRNFDWRWTVGGSTSPSNETYRGPYAASELEVQAWSQLALTHRPVFGISYHSYSAVVMYPWRYQSQPTPDEDVLLTTATRMAQLIGYGVSTSSGSNQSEDWLYARAGQFDFLIETARSEFVPRAESIPVICAQNFHADTFLFNRMFYAGIRGHVKDAATDSPLVAQVQVIGRVDTALAPRVSEPVFGRFHRVLNPGQYDLRFIAAGYDSLLVTGVPVVAESLTRLEIRLTGPTGIRGNEPGRVCPKLRVVPNPFCQTTRAPGFESTRLGLFDAAGSRLPACLGASVGAGLAPGVYFLEAPGGETIRLVKLR